MAQNTSPAVKYRVMSLWRGYISDIDHVSINNRGDIVAMRNTDRKNKVDGCLVSITMEYRHGHWSELPNTSGDRYTPNTQPCGINDSGDTLGERSGCFNGAYMICNSYIVEWHLGHMLGVSIPSDGQTDPVGFNNRGDIAFSTHDDGPLDLDSDTGSEKAFLLTGGKTIDLGLGVPCCLNNKGDTIVSLKHRSTDTTEYTLWSGGAKKQISLPQTVGQILSVTGINDNDEISGTCDMNSEVANQNNPGNRRGFVLTKAGITIIKSKNCAYSDALAINNRCQVVGSMFDQIGYAFLYDKGILYNLNDLLPMHSGWKLTSAIAMNNRGQIVCTGNKGLCLLTPIC